VTANTTITVYSLLVTDIFNAFKVLQ